MLHFYTFYQTIRMLSSKLMEDGWLLNLYISEKIGSQIHCCRQLKRFVNLPHSVQPNIRYALFRAAHSRYMTKRRSSWYNSARHGICYTCYSKRYIHLDSTIRAIQFSTFCWFCGINRDREVAPTGKEGSGIGVPSYRKMKCS